MANSTATVAFTSLSNPRAFGMGAAPEPAAMACGNVVVNLQTFSEAAYPGGFNAFVNATQTAIIIPPLDNTKTSFCPGGSGEYVYFPILSSAWVWYVTVHLPWVVTVHLPWVRQVPGGSLAVRLFGHTRRFL